MIRAAAACALLLAGTGPTLSQTPANFRSSCLAPHGGAVSLVRVLQNPTYGRAGRVMTTVGCAVDGAQAEREALNLCRQYNLDGACEVATTFTKGCGYITRGVTPWSVTATFGATPQKAYDSCRDLGLDCAPESTVNGCIFPAEPEPVDKVITRPPVSRWVSGAFSTNRRAHGADATVALAYGLTAALAETDARGLCEARREKEGIPGTCTPYSAQQVGCLAISVGKHPTSRAVRVVSDADKDKALERCNTDGFVCAKENVLSGCAVP